MTVELFKSHANICTRFGVKLIGHLHAGVIAQIKKGAKVDLNMRCADLRDISYTSEGKR